MNTLLQAAKVFVSSCYPVSKEIDERGYRWCEAYLDQALLIANAAILKNERQETLTDENIIALAFHSRLHLNFGIEAAYTEEQKYNREAVLGFARSVLAAQAEKTA